MTEVDPKQNAVPTDWTKYPSVTLAYDVAKVTLATSIAREDSWSQSLEKSLAWGTTVTLALLGFVASQYKHGMKLDYCNPWFITSGAFLIAALIVSIGGRFWGGVMDFDPAHIHRAWLGSVDEKFKADYIFAAGTFCTHNARVTLIKAWATTISSVLFVLQGIAIITWVLSW